MEYSVCSKRGLPITVARASASHTSNRETSGINARSHNVANSGRILLTGITGCVGSWLAREALLRGYRIAALVRGESQAEAQARVRTVLDITGAGHLYANVDIVRGDIVTNDCGLSGQTEAQLRDVDRVIHCAAWTAFDESAATLVRRTNVDGTHHVMELTARLGKPLVHVSTAYVSGQRLGCVTEAQLDEGQAFRNAYERSKCDAEGLIRTWATETGLPTTILRPSIVVGDSTDGRLARFNTLYDFMRAFDVAARRIRGAPFRVNARPDVAKNFIPVDYVAQAAWHILDRGVPGTYHLTHPDPMTVEGMREIFSELFEVDSIRLVESDAFEQEGPTPVERLYQKATAVYTPYMLAEATFDRTNTDAALADANLSVPVLDLPYFRRALDYARAANWGRSKNAPKAPKPATPEVHAYFAEFLTGKMHEQLVPGLRTLTADFHIVLSDVMDCRWLLSIVEGRLENVSHGDGGAPCSFVLDAATFTEIVAGRLKPQNAFFSRRVDIEGDIETGLKLATRLAAFFKQFPYETGRQALA